MNAILKYPGAKWQMASWIISLFPSHDTYVEPFFGSGAVFFQKPLAKMTTINDLDEDIYNFFKICRDQPEELQRLLARTPWSRKEQKLAFEPTIEPLERARRFAIRCHQTIGQPHHKTSGWRIQLQSGDSRIQRWIELPGIVPVICEKLRQAHIECRPAVSVIKQSNFPNVLIYADPPYVMSTIKTSGYMYSHNMTDKEHEELIVALKAHSGYVLLSGYENDLYNALLPDWTKRTKPSLTMISTKRTEVVWINPKASAHLAQKSFFDA